MIEHALTFGPEDCLVGVLTSPAHTASPDELVVTGAESPPVVHILFNAGVISRIGPHRTNVRLARALAAQGEWVLRFDLSGLGDSRQALGNLDARAQAIADLQTAMDFLAQLLGAQRFNLIGICSGAVYSFWTAMADPRVTGLFMIDGFWYRTLWTKPMRDWKRLQQVSLRQALAAVVRRTKASGGVPSAPKAKPPSEGSLLDYMSLSNPPRPEFEAAMSQLVGRGVAIHFFYTGTVLEYYSYGRQFRHAFGSQVWASAVQCSYRPEVDHTLISGESQRVLQQTVLGWVAALKPRV
jgi:hypothetical protein